MNIFSRLHIDKHLFYALVALSMLSLFILYSASAENTKVVLAHTVKLVIGFSIMLVVAQIRPESFARWAPYIFSIGFILLVIVLLVGATRKGAQSWFNLGIIDFQPSEVMKLGLPMILAWYLAKHDLPPRLSRIGLCLIFILAPVYLIYEQPDLGTALMVMASGIFVLFLAGLRWTMITALVGTVAAAMPFAWNYMLHDYQKLRILNVFNPQNDPLDSGYHIIQSTIAVGSGGFFGKGWLNGSQVHLNFLPEPDSDFIFAVFSEEFGFIGALLLFGIFLFIIGRGLIIAFYAQDTFNRLLAGSLIMTFFLYFFVNIGMVIGLLPVVGVPLPLLSKGGSSIVTLMIAFGMLMSIQTHRKIVQH